MIEEIGRYKIIDVLGQGNMATVYKAHDPQINRTLAIKVLRPERCIDAEYRSRFLRESRAVGTLNHPNIVTIYDVGEVDNTPYIAMELLEGIPLDTFINDGEQLNLSDIISLGIQIASALDYAHERNIIHRDIKPSNIVLSTDRKTARLTDFGIARVEEVDITQHTQIGNLLGTPQYMSPEQVLGEQVDARSDLFSLGTILYQLISNKKPFPATNLATLLFQVATEPPIPIGIHNKNIPDSLKTVIDRLLKKDVSERFQTGKAVVLSLRSVLQELSPKNEAIPRIVKHAPQSNDRIGLFASISLLISCFLAFGVFHYSEQQRLQQEHFYAYGNTLSKFITENAAEPVLNEDWRTLEILAMDFMEKYQLSAINISNHENLIKASDKEIYINQDINEIRPNLESLNEHSFNDRRLSFVSPIVFGNQTIGNIYFEVGEEHNPAIGHFAKQPTFYSAIFLFIMCLVSVFILSRKGVEK